MKPAELKAAISAGALYLAIGLIFGLLAGRAATSAGRIAWRWAAWIASAVVFGRHIVYERIQMGRSSLVTAAWASTAAATGAFGLAVAANIHTYILSTQETALTRPHSFALRRSLIIWPVLIAAPAFLVALAGAILIPRLLIFIRR